MAEINYIVNQSNPDDTPGFENFSSTDLSLVNQFQVNNLFDTNKHFVELHIADLSGTIIETDPNYSNYKLLGTAQSAGRQGASILTVDPVQDVQDYGYDTGGIRLLYNFLNDLYTGTKATTQFFISAISPDRTEIQLKNLNLSNQDIIDYTSVVKTRLSSQAYFDGFRLNFGNNELLIGINIDNLLAGADQTVIVRLYEPLPTTYSTGTTLSIVEIISDPVSYEVDTTFEFEETPLNRLRPANFNIEITDNQVIPTQYLAYNDLFSYPVNNTNNQLYSLVSERGVELSIDHTDYADFVHFSSAYERLANFKYKLQLIENYTNSLTLIQTATSQSLGTTGSVNHYQNLITGVVNNFDHYERYLYYQSSSYAWPKSNSTQPYENFPSTASQAISWYANQLATANYYDMNNGNILINSIPVYLREDSNNENYLTFVHMIGQHFDNLWIYAKAVTDKYDADNRLNHGIPKDLVGEALRNFGVKLYTSNKSIENLFASFIGQGYQSGSEVINTYITGSVTGSNLPVEDISFNDYIKEVQKRIYHNLSYIVKTKGTERGVRALINCFGIPSDILKIKLYGGRNTTERPFYGDFRYYTSSYFTSSLDKIRLDNTGSIVTGSVLSQYTSIYRRDKKYTDDLHRVEIGFSPVDDVDNLIISYSLATASLSTFNIDDYIGDPRNLYNSEYSLINATGSAVGTLEQITNQIMSSSAAYNVQDYVRLIKFFDNVVFKMVRDYVPGRSTVDTGIIIKPHLLQRSKAKSPRLTVSQSQTYITGSVEAAPSPRLNPGTFGGRDQYTSSYIELIQTVTGPLPYYGNNNEQPTYNGELEGGGVLITEGELNEENIYKDLQIGGYPGNFNFVSSSNEVCLLDVVPSSDPLIITESTFNITSDLLFQYTRQATVYLTSTVGSAIGTPPGDPYSSTTFPFNFSSYNNYDEIIVSASNVDVIQQPCIAQIKVRFATCSIAISSTAPTFFTSTQLGAPIDITSYFNVNPLQTQIQYTASYEGNSYGITNPTSWLFPDNTPRTYTFTVVDPLSSNCSRSHTINISNCLFARIDTGSDGLEGEFSTDQYGSGRKFLGLPLTTPVSKYMEGYIGFFYVEGQIQPDRFRGLQSYFTPYLNIPPDTLYTVYEIYNVDDNNLSDNTKYINGTDQYFYRLKYFELAPGAANPEEFNSDMERELREYAGGPEEQNSPLPVPLDQLGSINSNTFAQEDYNSSQLWEGLPHWRPVLVSTYDYSGAYNTTPPTTLTDIRRRPVAWHIQTTSTVQGICVQSITIYPNQYRTVLSPPVSSELEGYVNIPPSYIWGNTLTTTQIPSKYIFTDRTVTPQQGTYYEGYPSITVPIRKRIKL